MSADANRSTGGGDIAALAALEERDVRALTEYMSVLDDIGQVRDVQNMYLVVTGSGTYVVEPALGTCTCNDHFYRDTSCKHLRRVTYATGMRPVPAAADQAAIDPQLGEWCDGEVEYA